MNLRFRTRFARALALFGFVAAVAPLAAQTTTSSLAGQIDSDKGGPVAGATVVVVNVPTNSSITTSTNEAGRFVLGGLNVGGPYEVTVTAPGFRPTAQRGIYLELSKTYRVGIVLATSSELVELEEFVVESGTTTVFDTDAIGTGSVIDSTQIASTANVRRAISDFARLNPLVTLGDSDRLEINAAGQHYRQNSIQVDGVNINDQFGLEASGLPSLNNPISINTIAQFNVEISPYDVRQSGFTGAAINAVTRSGTNQFSGEAYYYFSGDNLRGANVNTGRKDPYEEKTYGFILSGPIWKDRLFFFYNYENFEKTLAASNPNFIPSVASVDAIRARMNALGYDVGTYGGGTAQEVDDKHFLKIDAVISSQHRLTARYAETISSSPNFGRFSDNNQTSLSSGFYENAFKTTSYGVQAFSRWSDRFETEISVARDNFDKVPSTSELPFPEVEIVGVPGTTATGAATTGTVYFGTERSRQANELFTETDKAKAIGNYYLDRHTITFGVDTEVSKFENVFAQDVFGRIRFTGTSGYTNFLNPAFGIGSSITRPAQVAGTSILATSDYTVTGLFLQDKWEVNDRLQVIFGVRYDLMGVDDRPFVNNLFNTTFTSYDGRSGWNNAKTIDGTSSFGPRVGFRWDLDEEKTTLLRGGVGLFQGKVPGVYISNAYSNTGVTQGSITYASTTTLDQYVQQFDPANPIATVPNALSSPANINTIDKDFELPAVWRANLAIDRKLFADWIGTIELIRTEVEKGVYVENLNLRPVSTSPDGRTIFAGNPSTAANAFNSSFLSVFNMRNTSKGSATNLVLSLSRPMKNNWWANASYTWTDSTDVSSVTSSTASSNFGNRAVFNQNEDVAARSNYEFRHRILVNGGYGFELKEGWKSRVGLTYEGRSGRPYSWVFRGDFNRDGVSFNDLFYVPTGPSDPKIGFATGTTQAQIDNFFKFMNDTGMSAYAGSVPARNSEVSSFMHRFDLNFTQVIPLRGRVQMELFANIINVGNLIDDSWGLVSEVPFSFAAGVADATISNNRIVYNLNTAPQGESVNANRSQWAIQVGATLKF